MMGQVERILESATFRNSEALRRLLRFLADKMMLGEADQLKEYTVGIDVLGKPPTYDPRHDSTVRIQVGRLRQKLAEYYRTEGKQDPLIVELPKGRFKLTCDPNPELAVEEVARAAPEPIPAVPKTSRWRWAALAAALVAVASIAVAILLSLRLAGERQQSEMFRAMWTPELEELWKPFLTGRPLTVSIADPPFVQFKGYGAYRDLQLNRWEDIVKSPQVVAIGKALGGAEVQPNVYYAPMGEVSASFLLGKLLGARVPSISLLRASELSLQQLANNNVLYIGAAVFFDDRMRGLPVELELQNARPGIHNLKPRPGEPEILSDVTPTGSAEDGETYVLITHVPGPLGTSDVEAFTSNRTPGRLAAVAWMTEPNYARILVAKLRGNSGKIPRFYQVVLKVKYKAGVPTETSYVFHHELHVSGQLGIQDPGR